MTTTLTDTKGAARHRWPSILEALGVDPAYLTGRHGPCYFCGGTDRFRFTDHNGDGMWICNNHGKGDGLDLLMEYHGWTLREASQKVGEIVGEAAYTAPRQEDEQKIRRSLNNLRGEAVPAGDAPPVVTYLHGRGLIVPPHLQAHPACPYYEGTDLIGRYPAMLGKLISPGGRPVGYHRTYLTPSGLKASVNSPRKMRKLPKTQGYAIRLWPATDTVVIAEGIETAIACHLLWGLPAWSVISAGEMLKFQPPEGVQNIVVAGDRDDSFTGQAAAYETGRRFRAAGYDATVAIPPSPGDWNDYLNEQRSAA